MKTKQMWSPELIASVLVLSMFFVPCAGGYAAGYGSRGAAPSAGESAGVVGGCGNVSEDISGPSTEMDGALLPANEEDIPDPDTSLPFSRPCPPEPWNKAVRWLYLRRVLRLRF